MTASVSVRELRAHLAPILDQVTKGEQVVVTRRGRRLARIVPDVARDASAPSRYPLRGSLVEMSPDFDEPMGEIWEALRA
jgi:prevent-host-death family protein